MRIRFPLTAAFVALAQLVVVPASATPAAASVMPGGDDVTTLSHDDLTERLGTLGAKVYYGGLMIAAGKHINGPVVVVAGPLDIQDGGVLEGDAWIVNGRLVLTGAARVTGRVDIVNGIASMSRNADVTGGIHRYRSESAIDADRFEKDGTLAFVEKEDPYVVHTRYKFRPGLATRVRYDALRVGLVRENDYNLDPHIRYELFTSIPVDKDTQHGFAGFDARATVPLRDHSLELTVAGFKTLHSEDLWQVGRIENSALLFIATNEFADWYEKRGGEVGVTWRPRWYVSGAVSGFYQDDVSMAKSRTWTVFGDNDDLPGNPGIDDGTRMGGRAMLTYDTREDETVPGSAWRFTAGVELGRLDRDASSDSASGASAAQSKLDYKTFTAGAYRYTRLPWGMSVDAGARVFTSIGAIPAQLTQSLGGWAGVRGASDEPFATRRGDRMALASVEVRREMPTVRVVDWVFSRWDAIAFADAGYLAMATYENRPWWFLKTSFGEWKKSVGIGIGGDAFIPYIAMYIAQEVDTNGDRPRPRFIIRMGKSF